LLKKYFPTAPNDLEQAALAVSAKHEPIVAERYVSIPMFENLKSISVNKYFEGNTKPLNTCILRFIHSHAIQLHELRINQCKSQLLKDLVSNGTFGKCTSMRRLDLSCNVVKHFGEAVMAMLSTELRNCKNLEDLDLSNVLLTNECIEFVNNLFQSDQVLAIEKSDVFFRQQNQLLNKLMTPKLHGNQMKRLKVDTFLKSTFATMLNLLNHLKCVDVPSICDEPSTCIPCIKFEELEAFSFYTHINNFEYLKEMTGVYTKGYRCKLKELRCIGPRMDMSILQDFVMTVTGSMQQVLQIRVLELSTFDFSSEATVATLVESCSRTLVELKLTYVSCAPNSQDTVMVAIGKCTKLQFLNISNSCVNALAISRLGSLRSLKHLDIGNVFEIAQRTHPLLEMANVNSLESLDCYKIAFNSHSADIFKGFCKFHFRLTYLNLSNCAVDSAGLEILFCSLQIMKHLQTLLLQYNVIDDKCCSAFASNCKEYSSITSVDMSMATISSTGAVAIISALVSNCRTTIRQIHLSNNGIRKLALENLIAFFLPTFRGVFTYKPLVVNLSFSIHAGNIKETIDTASLPLNIKCIL